MTSINSKINMHPHTLLDVEFTLPSGQLNACSSKCVNYIRVHFARACVCLRARHVIPSPVIWLKRLFYHFTSTLYFWCHSTPDQLISTLLKKKKKKRRKPPCRASSSCPTDIAALINWKQVFISRGNF